MRYSNYRFSRLVASRLQLNDLDMASFPEILELDLASPSMQQSRPFNYQLRYVVAGSLEMRSGSIGTTRSGK